MTSPGEAHSSAQSEAERDVLNRVRSELNRLGPPAAAATPRSGGEVMELVNSLFPAAGVPASSYDPRRADPRDILTTFGETEYRDRTLSVRYRDEASLRRGLATIAHAYGWLVEEEVVVPGWGRIDLVLREKESSPPRLVELKRELRKPASVRRAFQQADGYGRWWTQKHNESCTVSLAGAVVDAQVMSSVASAYPEVDGCTVADLMGRLRIWDNVRLRLSRALERQADLARLSAVYEAAREELRTRSGQLPA